MSEDERDPLAPPQGVAADGDPPYGDDRGPDDEAGEGETRYDADAERRARDQEAEQARQRRDSEGKRFETK